LESVHGVKVERGFLLRLTTGEEKDSWNGTWDSSRESPNGHLSDLLGGGLLFGLLATGDHVGFEDHSFKADVKLVESLEGSCKDFFRDLSASLDAVLTVHGAFWFDDWAEAVHLTDRGVLSKSVGDFSDGLLRWSVVTEADD
jgi:hypothetical protein